MTESTKSVTEVKESISEDVGKVHETVAQTSKDLKSLTKNIAEEKTSTFGAIKEHTAQDFKHMQENYDIKEERVFKLLKTPYNKNIQNNSEAVAAEYENILLENVGKLKEITKEDFALANENTQTLVEEAKRKLNVVLTQAFRAQESKKDFAKTTEELFLNVNEKIKKDLNIRHRKHERTASILQPDLSNIFINPTTKPPEEIEAENLLQMLLEDELLNYSEQFKKDFQAMGQNINTQVEETKNKLSNTIQSALQTEKPTLPTIEIKENNSIPNMPTTSTVEENVNIFLNKAKDDLDKAHENMQSDVIRNRTKINENVTKYANKIFGKHLFCFDDEEEE